MVKEGVGKAEVGVVEHPGNGGHKIGVKASEYTAVIEGDHGQQHKSEPKPGRWKEAPGAANPESNSYCDLLSDSAIKRRQLRKQCPGYYVARNTEK